VQHFECWANDGFKVNGLLSASPNAQALVVHVHGFGGDFISNKFVQQMHEALPASGVAFASFNHRLSGYVVEQYSERGVLYCGAAVSPPFQAVGDVQAVISLFASSYGRIILQGHSFGTNIVKNFVLKHGWADKLIFLSPSDSLWLYDEWRAGTRDSRRVQKNSESDDDVRFGIFGIGVQSVNYVLPMSFRNPKALLADDVFLEWSTSEAVCTNECLVIFGTSDPVANNGKTKSLRQMLKWLPSARIERVVGAGHLFSGSERFITERVRAWVYGCTPRLSP
jgi:pimeloyl-ACP methyl ester carboxylesterase